MVSIFPVLYIGLGILFVLVVLALLSRSFTEDKERFAETDTVTDLTE